MSGTVLAIFVCLDHTFDAELSALAEEGIRLTKMGIGQIPHSGKPDQRLDHYGISAWAIVEKVKQLAQVCQSMSPPSNFDLISLFACLSGPKRRERANHAIQIPIKK